ncbi:MAG TPA: CBS domain-containing protein [Anaerolineaceae bacterium]
MDTVRHILQLKGKDVWSIRPDATVLDSLRMMDSKGVGALVVTQDNHLVGIISERDYARKVILKGKSSKDTLVSEIMTAHVITVDPDQTLDECMELMTTKSIRHLPVVDGERVVGVISMRDVMAAIIHRQREALRQTEPRTYGP